MILTCKDKHKKYECFSQYNQREVMQIKFQKNFFFMSPNKRLVSDARSTAINSTSVLVSKFCGAAKCCA